MSKWANITIGVLIVIALIILGIALFFTNQNTKSQGNFILYPFAGTLPSGQGQNPANGVALVNNQGEPQIQCPAGYHINIVGAYTEVVDAFGECSTPLGIFKATCGDTSSSASSLGACRSDSDCPDSMTCSQGACVAKTCSANSDCGATSCPIPTNAACQNYGDCGGAPMYCYKPNPTQPGTCMVDPSQGACTQCINGKCVSMPLCSNLNSDYQNTACSNSACVPRDSSAYLADACDGKQSCSILWDPSDPKYFGPIPCNFQVNSTSYNSLPIIPGWQGGAPAQSQSGTSVPPNYSQGYYVHGIYTCVKD